MDIAILDKHFSYQLTRLPNDYGFELIIWNEYSSSLFGKGYTIKEAYEEALLDTWS